MKKKIFAVIFGAMSIISLVGCTSDNPYAEPLIPWTVWVFHIVLPLITIPILVPTIFAIKDKGKNKKSDFEQLLINEKKYPLSFSAKYGVISKFLLENKWEQKPIEQKLQETELKLTTGNVPYIQKCLAQNYKGDNKYKALMSSMQEGKTFDQIETILKEIEEKEKAELEAKKREKEELERKTLEEKELARRELQIRHNELVEEYIDEIKKRHPLFFEKDTFMKSGIIQLLKSGYTIGEIRRILKQEVSLIKSNKEFDEKEIKSILSSKLYSLRTGDDSHRSLGTKSIEKLLGISKFEIWTIPSALEFNLFLIGVMLLFEKGYSEKQVASVLEEEPVYEISLEIYSIKNIRQTTERDRLFQEANMLLQEVKLKMERERDIMIQENASEQLQIQQKAEEDRQWRQRMADSEERRYREREEELQRKRGYQEMEHQQKMEKIARQQLEAQRKAENDRKYQQKQANFDSRQVANARATGRCRNCLYLNSCNRMKCTYSPK
ncbi:MAG: hypothetical protein FWE03_05080 [Firmicutes bacterium]|nr:hypothetical protein [Bacillota bacterium]